MKAQEEEGWINRYVYKKENGMTFNLGPQVFWDNKTDSWEELEFVENPTFASVGDCRYFIRNSHIALEICDIYVKLWDPDYTTVSVYSEQWSVEFWQKEDLFWKDTGIGIQTPTWQVSQTDDCVNITRMQNLVGVGELNLSYVVRKGCLLKHDVIYKNISPNDKYNTDYRAVMSWAGIASAKYKTEDEEFTVTGEKHKVTSWFRSGESDSNLVLSEYLDSLGTYNEMGHWNSDKLQDIVFDTHAAGSKVDIIIGNYMLGQDESLEIDPTTSTFPITTDGLCGYVVAVNADYQTAHDEATGSSAVLTYVGTGQSFLIGDFYVYRGFLNFDTSSLPDTASVSGVKLKLNCQNDYSTTDFTVRLQNWTDPNDGIDTDDYSKFDGVNYDDGQWNSSSYDDDQYIDIIITDFTIVDPTGNTTLCLRSAEDISSSEPINLEYIWFHDEDADHEPKLEVTYTSGSEVTLNSPLNNAKIENCSKVDFKYTPVFFETIQNSSLYTNLTSSWALTQANTTTVTNNTENTITYTFTSDTVIIWNVGVYNSTMEIFASSNFTLTIETFYNFVDNNTSDEDSSADKGTHSNFESEKAVDGMDTLTEANTGGSVVTTELVVDGNTSDHQQWTVYGTQPYLDAIDYDTNYLYIDAVDNYKQGNFTFTDGTDLGIINNVKLCVYSCQANTDNGQIDLYVTNSTGEYSIHTYTPANNMAWAWENTSVITTWATWTEINNAHLTVVAQREGGADLLYVDMALIWVNYTSYNYELDLEEQWTNANYTRANEELCIKTGTFSGSEDIQVKVRSGGSWVWVMNLTASQWNNVSVSTYLTASTFTIQFLGGTETSDPTQDTWQKDCALLHTWEAAGDTYAVDLTQSVTVSYSETEKWTVTQQLSFNPNVEFTKTVGWTTSLSISWTSTIGYTQEALATFPISLSITTDVAYTQQETWNSKVSITYSSNVDYTKQVDWTAGISVSFSPNVDYVGDVDWQTSLSLSWQPNVDYQESDVWTSTNPLSFSPNVDYSKTEKWNANLQIDFSPNTQFSKTIDWTTSLSLTWNPNVDYTEQTGWISTVPLVWNPTIDLQKQTQWQSTLTIDYSPSITYSKQVDWTSQLPLTFSPNVDYTQQEQWTSNVPLIWNPALSYQKQTSWQTSISIDYQPSVAYSIDKTWQAVVSVNFQPSFSFTLDIVHTIGGVLHQVVLDFASSIGLVTDTTWTSIITFDYTTQIAYTKQLEWISDVTLAFSPDVEYTKQIGWASTLPLSFNPAVGYTEQTEWNTFLSFTLSPNVDYGKTVGWDSEVSVGFNPNVDYVKQIGWDIGLDLAWNPTVGFEETEQWSTAIPLSWQGNVQYSLERAWQAKISFVYAPSITYDKLVEWDTSLFVGFNPNVDYTQQSEWTATTALSWNPNVAYQKSEEWQATIAIDYSPNIAYSLDKTWQTVVTANFQPSFTWNLDISQFIIHHVVLDFVSSIGWLTDIGWNTKITFDYTPQVTFAKQVDWTSGLTLAFSPDVEYTKQIDWTSTVPISFNPAVAYTEQTGWSSFVSFSLTPNVDYTKDIDWIGGLTLTFTPDIGYTEQVSWTSKIPLTWTSSIGYQKAELWNSKLQITFTPNVDYTELLDWSTSLALTWNPNVDYTKQVDWTANVPLTWISTVGYTKTEQWQSRLTVDWSPNVQYSMDESWQTSVTVNFQPSFSLVLDVNHITGAFYQVILDFATSIGWQTSIEWTSTVTIDYSPNIQYTKNIDWSTGITLTFNPNMQYSITVTIPPPPSQAGPGPSPPRIDLTLAQPSAVYINILQYWSREATVTVNVTVDNYSPYSSGTLSYRIVSLDTNETVLGWTEGEPRTIELGAKSNVTVTTTVPLRQTLEIDTYRIEIMFAVSKQTLEGEATFTVNKSMVEQFFTSLGVGSLCFTLVGLAYFSHKKRRKPWDKYPEPRQT